VKLYIVRHAQSNRNIGIHSDVDTGLSEIGYEQAKRLGLYFKKVKVDRIYCSTLKRTRDTLKGILPYLKNVPVTYTKEIIEHKIGLYRDRMDEPMTVYIDEFCKEELK